MAIFQPTNVADIAHRVFANPLPGRAHFVYEDDPAPGNPHGLRSRAQSGSSAQPVDSYLERACAAKSLSSSPKEPICH